jgi:hypothetical protein
MQLIQSNSRALVAIFTLALSMLAGCADTSPIQPSSSGKSQFEGAVYQGESVTISKSTPGTEEFRVFHQGATGFVSVQSVREDAEQRATQFCARNERAMKALRETTSKPPHILGNFPRIEIIFACVEKQPLVASPTGEDPKYSKLVNLKKLLDTGILTQQEFEREKAKTLNLH